MQTRNNVRERRRERIEQLMGQHAMEDRDHAEPSVEETRKPKGKATEESSRSDHATEESMRFDSATPYSKSDLPRYEANSPRKTADNANRDDRSAYFSTVAPSNEPDPELWWREREKQLKSGQASGWQGLKGIPPTSAARTNPPPDGSDIRLFIRGVSFRFVVAALAFAGIWGWFKLEMPGSVEGRAWMVSSVTRDMDFEAIEAWYGSTFGGSPSFLPFNRDEPDTKEVSALLNPSETALPVQGRIVQTYAQNGTGVKVAAPGGSEVSSIYTGRVVQVNNDPNSGVTISVQHQNQVISVYGSLEESSVKPNDWVVTGQRLGQLKRSEDSQTEGILYFAVQQRGKALNPAEVVSFD